MMGEYVKRSDALQAVGDIHPLDYNGQGIVERIQAIPAADVVKVRHAHWCVTDAYPHHVYCSACFITFAQEHWEIWKDGSLPRDYCPNCGAKMNGGQDDGE